MSNPIWNEVEAKKERRQNDKIEMLRKTGLKEHEIKAQLEESEKNKEEKKEVIICRTIQDVQKRKLDRLMNNPTREAYIPQPRKEWKPRDPAEFVRHVMGSSAGAGSGEFHVYRNLRKRENKRQEYLEKKSKKEELDDEFQQKLEDNKQNADSGTNKKRAKRQKRKQKKMQAKHAKEDTPEVAVTKNFDEDDDTEDSKSEGEQPQGEGEQEESHFVIGGK